MSLSVLDDSQWFSAASIALGTSFEENASSSVILDPLANEHYHLLIYDLLKLEPVGDLNVFRFGPHWVLYVDVVGIIRSLMERDKFYLIDVDDGTGCVTCTIWRQPNESRRSQTCIQPDSTRDSNYNRVCEHLLSLANSEQSARNAEDRADPLQIGLQIRLRGRVKRFRGRINVNASSYRILSDPQEELIEILERDRLKREVYQKPYDPAKICAQVLKSLAIPLSRPNFGSSNSPYTPEASDSSVVLPECMSSGAQLTVTEACRILEEDALFTFTKLDLCLNSRLADRLLSNSNPVVFDPSDVTPVDWPAELGVKDVRSLVDELLKYLVTEGWIYPSSEPIGGHVAYHFLNGDDRIEEAVFSAIHHITSRNTECQGASVVAILNIVRLSRLGSWHRFTLPALRRILGRLEASSRIFQVQPSMYKIA